MTFTALMFAFIAILLFAGLIAWGAYRFFFREGQVIDGGKEADE